jgi:hypothetical protein
MRGIRVQFRSAGGPWVYVKTGGSGGTTDPDAAYVFPDYESARERVLAMTRHPSSLDARVLGVEAPPPFKPGLPRRRTKKPGVIALAKGYSSASEDLKSRAARALGWSEADVRRMSWLSLREVVRHVDPALAEEITVHNRTGRGLL